MMHATKWITLVFMMDQNTFLQALGQKIQTLRKDSGLTQTQFGAALNLSQQVIADYEAGLRNIPVYTLLRMANVLGMNLGDLQLDKDSPPRKRGPSPMIQRQLEQIQALPKEKQKFVLQALQMALKTN